MTKIKNYFDKHIANFVGIKVSILTVKTRSVVFIDTLRHCVHRYTYLGRPPIKNKCPKNTDMNIAEIACFLSLLMGLR